MAVTQLKRKERKNRVTAKAATIGAKRGRLATYAKPTTESPE